MDKITEVKEWFIYAKKDYDAAIFLKAMLPNPVEIICYHCQQSAEKYLKGFLISKNIQIIKTHDLNILHEKCLEIDKDFEKIRIECGNLTDYSIPTRYPGNIEITEDDMGKALVDCDKIKAFIENKTNYLFKETDGE